MSLISNRGKIQDTWLPAVASLKRQVYNSLLWEAYEQVSTKSNIIIDIIRAQGWENMGDHRDSRGGG